MNNWLRKCSIVATASLAIASCELSPMITPSIAPPTSEPTQSLQASALRYLVSIDEDEVADLRVASAVFEVVTDNCGSETSSIERYTQDAEFKADLEITLTEAITAAVGGGVPGVAQATLEAEVGLSMGVSIGASRSAKGERTLETPPDRITITRLQWEEVWSPGVISVEGVGEAPFLMLTALRLGQRGVTTMRCDGESEKPASPLPVSIWEDVERAFDCAEEYLRTRGSTALCDDIWLNTGTNKTHLVGYILERQILARFPEISGVEWVVDDIRDSELDQTYSTGQVHVYGLVIDTTLTINGAVKCPGGNQQPVEHLELRHSGRARVEVLNPGGADEETRIYSWIVHSDPAVDYCEAQS